MTTFVSHTISPTIVLLLIAVICLEARATFIGRLAFQAYAK